MANALRRLCTICARGGSKGLPGKNIRPLLGKPLIQWTVEHAVASGLFETIAVSSNDDAILAAAKNDGATLLVKRPEELATDTASKLPAIVHAVEAAESAAGARFDIIVELDATSPLRDVKDVTGAVAMLESEGRTNIITGAPARRSPYFNLVETDANGVATLSKPMSGIARRQDAPSAYDMNASIYVWKRDAFMSAPSVFYHDTGIFVMPEERSHDIDLLLDFKIVEMLLKERGQTATPSYRQAYDLTGKVAIVTGAGGILGRKFCSILAEHGAVIAAVDTAAGPLDETGEMIASVYGTRVGKYLLDVTDPAAVRETVARIEGELGPVSILHNNAASKGPDLARFFDAPLDFDPNIWRSVMEVNVDGYFYMLREAGARMAARGGGSIIQTGSIYGHLAPDQRIYEGSEYLGRPINTPAVYSASKAAVIGLTRYFASYWGHRGVRVNTLTPGGVKSGQNNVFHSKYSARVPLGRMAEADEIAQGLLFLASDASSYVSGQNLIIDGGLSVW